jgi:hypothetical protein
MVGLLQVSLVHSTSQHLAKIWGCVRNIACRYGDSSILLRLDTSTLLQDLAEVNDQQDLVEGFNELQNIAEGFNDHY